MSEALHISRKTLQKIRQNLVWAFAYNAVAITLAAAALLPATGLALTPSIAGTACSPHSSYQVCSQAACYCSPLLAPASTGPVSAEFVMLMLVVCGRCHDGLQLPGSHGQLHAAPPGGGQAGVPACSPAAPAAASEPAGSTAAPTRADAQERGCTCRLPGPFAGVKCGRKLDCGQDRSAGLNEKRLQPNSSEPYSCTWHRHQAAQQQSSTSPAHQSRHEQCCGIMMCTSLLPIRQSRLEAADASRGDQLQLLHACPHVVFNACMAVDLKCAEQATGPQSGHSRWRSNGSMSRCLHMHCMSWLAAIRTIHAMAVQYLSSCCRACCLRSAASAWSARPAALRSTSLYRASTCLCSRH